MPGYQELLVVGKNRYKSLVFDFDKVNNLNSYYENYRIPREEKMMVYAYSSSFSTLSLEGSGTIITDQAIYIDPVHKNWAPTNRIPLSSLCQFVVFQEESTENVHLLNESNNCKIFAKTVAPKDTTGRELVQLLRNLQKNITRMNMKERHSYEMTVGWMLDLIRKSMHDNGRLTPRDEMLLSVAEEESSFVKDIIFIRAENIYRSGDDCAYQLFLQNIKEQVDKEVFAVLERPEDLFFDAFISDIANANSFYMTKELIEPYLNFKKKERLTLKQCMLLAYLSIRIEDLDYATDLMDMIGLKLKSEDFWHYQAFCTKYQKEKLSLVYEKLEGDGEVSGPELYWQDDLGLTALHYALILKKKDAAKKMLTMRNWCEFSSPFPKDKIIDLMYHPVFLTAILYDDEEFISEVFSLTSTAAKALTRSIERMDSFISIQRTMMREHPENAMAHARLIADYETMKKEMVEELLQMAHSATQEARSHAAVIIETGHPFAKYILHMYLSRDSIYRSIADTISDYRVYRYKDKYFLTSIDHDLDLSFYEWVDGKIDAHFFKKTDTDLSMHMGEESFAYDGDTYENPDLRAARAKEEQEKRAKFDEARKAYEATVEDTSRFFSQAAYTDISILKKEYRALVKVYHPDVTGNRSATSIMQQIQTERAEILEKMGTMMTS